MTESVDPAGPTCANCGAVATGAFCPVCGQATKGELPTVREFFQEFVDHHGHLEGKLWRTLGMLFFFPGKLTRAYLANKRVRYVTPVKLYLAASALAFAAVQFLRFDLGLQWSADGGLSSFNYLGRSEADKLRAEKGFTHSTWP